MYDLYVKNFSILDSIYSTYDGGIALCCAFSYVGQRESRWGSWGHLENYDQLNNLANIKTIAPKYAAMLDFNTARSPIFSLPRAGRAGAAARLFRCVGMVETRDGVTLRCAVARDARVRMTLLDPLGRTLGVVTDERYAPGVHTVHIDRTTKVGRHLGTGMYLLRARILAGNAAGTEEVKLFLRG
jgi:hypothetical protein